MAYEKQNFVDGQVLTAAHLNYIEDRIAAIPDFGEVITETNVIPLMGDEPVAVDMSSMYGAEGAGLVYLGELPPSLQTSTVSVDYTTSAGVTSSEQTFAAQTMAEGIVQWGLNPIVFYTTTEENFDLGGMIFPKAGVYMENRECILVNDPSFESLVITFPETFAVSSVKTLDEKYLPESVMQNGDTEIILASSTSGSTKKFRITVDDSGSLTAVEVT